MNLNATMVAQAIVFFVLALFTMRFVWPPLIKAIDDRREKIRDGLEAAEKSRQAFKDAEQKIQQDLVAARTENNERIQNAERQAKKIADEIKLNAQAEAHKALEDARLQIQAETNKAREQLRQELGTLIIKGAEQILKREINSSVHADIVSRAQTEFAK